MSGSWLLVWKWSRYLTLRILYCHLASSIAAESWTRNLSFWKLAIASCAVLSPIWLCATPWTVAHQASVSKGFPRQEYWSGLPFPSPGYLPDPGRSNSRPCLCLQHKQADFFLPLALRLCCCSWIFPSCGEQGLLFTVMRGLLIAVASHCGAQALGAQALVGAAHGL